MTTDFEKMFDERIQDVRPYFIVRCDDLDANELAPAVIIIGQGVSWTLLPLVFDGEGSGLALDVFCHVDARERALPDNIRQMVAWRTVPLR